MLEQAPPVFDTQLHPDGLSDTDLESLRVFGVRAALVAAHHFPEPSARALLGHFDDIVTRQLPRLERAGLRAYAALGVHPRCVPRRGLSEVLSQLPAYFHGGKVVAVGAIGLHRGGEEEEEAFVEQVALARRLKLPAIVHTPIRDKERVTRRTLALLRDTSLPPGRVLVDRASGRTVRTIIACGHVAGLTIHPDELPAERAVALIRKFGSARLVLSSHAGEGASDMLGLPRLVSLLSRAKLSRHVIARVSFQNALDFLHLSSI